MTEPEALDLFAALEARERAFQSMEITEGAWFDHALEAVARLPQNWTGTGEDIRMFLYELGVALPLKSNAWGALVQRAAKRNLIGETGEWRRARDKSSRGARSPVYRRLPAHG